MRTYRINRPLYQELRNRLAQEIASGVYPAGAELPSLAEMAQRYTVSPGTAGRVIELLAEEGLIRCRRGRRPRVAAHTTPARHNFRIAILLDCPDRDGVHPYSEGPWAWTLHQKLLTRLLNDHNPALTLSFRYEWEKQLSGVDGVIALEAYHQLYHEPDKLEKYRIPYIRIQSAALLPELPVTNTVYQDHGASGRQAATYFLAHGVKYVFAQNFEKELWPLRNPHDRLFEFYGMLLDKGIPENHIIRTARNGISFLPDSASMLRLKDLLQRDPEPVGILANDISARYVIDLGLSCRRTLKKDFCVIGSAGLSSLDAATPSPAITSISAPFQEMADNALDMLYGMLGRRETHCENRAISGHFQVRDT